MAGDERIDPLTDERFRALWPWFEEHRRDAWVPVCRAEREDDALLANRIGGTPALRAGVGQPCCGDCGEELALFLQLDTATLPMGMPAVGTKGVLQVFYCATACESGGGWEPFSPKHVLRLVERAALTERGAAKLAGAVVESWAKVSDVPGYDEASVLGLEVDWPHRVEGFVATWGDQRVGPLPFGDEPVPWEGDKLAGWPSWIQGVAYPRCPQCDSRMQLVFQLDSEVNLRYMFGDSGIGHVTQCPNHPAVLAFGWACS